MSARRFKNLDTGLLEYLERASEDSVSQIALDKLGDASNLSRRVIEVLQEWVRARAEALFADWVLDRRKRGVYCEVCDRETVHLEDPAA